MITEILSDKMIPRSIR